MEPLSGFEQGTPGLGFENRVQLIVMIFIVVVFPDMILYYFLDQIIQSDICQITVNINFNFRCHEYFFYWWTMFLILISQIYGNLLQFESPSTPPPTPFLK